MYGQDHYQPVNVRYCFILPVLAAFSCLNCFLSFNAIQYLPYGCVLLETFNSLILVFIEAYRFFKTTAVVLVASIVNISEPL